MKKNNSCRICSGKCSGKTPKQLFPKIKKRNIGGFKDAGSLITEDLEFNKSIDLNSILYRARLWADQEVDCFQYINELNNTIRILSNDVSTFKRRYRKTLKRLKVNRGKLKGKRGKK